MSSVLSERLQMRKLAEKVDATENFALIYFVGEEKYSVVSASAIVEAKYKTGDHVYVKDCGRPYSGKVIFVGPRQSCETRLKSLERVLEVQCQAQEDSNDTPPAPKKPKASTSKKSSTWKEKMVEEQSRLDELIARREDSAGTAFEDSGESDAENFSQDSPIMSPTPERSDSPEELLTRITGLEADVGRIEKKLDIAIALLKENTGSSSSRCSSPGNLLASTPNKGKTESMYLDTSLDASESEDYLYNGVNLLAEFAAPKDPKKYALRLMGILFSEDEMIKGMVGPLNPKSKKEELDNVRIELLKRCILKKYGEKIFKKMWNEIRTSCNQKGCDLLKKRRRTATME